MKQEPLHNCTGCTDKNSEGTHQMHTIQHPCPENGDPNCGYCFPEKTPHIEKIAERVASKLDARTVTSHSHFQEMVKKEVVSALTDSFNQGALAVIEEIKQMAPFLLIKSKGKEERIEYDIGVQEYLARIDTLEAKIQEK